MTLKAIAKETQTPEAFTAKVLQKLTHAELILSTKGPGGGFSMPPALARKVKLNQIVSVIDGDSIYTGCALGLPQCDARNPCALHEHFLKVREDLRSMLDRTSMSDVVKSMKEGVMVLRRLVP